jgi:hypothetical protein
MVEFALCVYETLVVRFCACAVSLNRAWVREIGRSPNRRFEFHKSRQLFIRAHNETLSSTRCASTIQIVRPLESIAATQPQLQPALLRLSAMISQYFTAASCSMRHAVPLSPAFQAREVAPNTSANRDHPAAVFASRKFAQAPRSQAARSSRARPPSAQLHNIAAACCGQARAASVSES